MRAPVSQMSAAVLPAGTEQLALVTALVQRSDAARALGLSMTAVLLEHKSKVLSDEFRTRDSTLARRPREQPIVVRIQRDGGRLLPRECHGSNMTCREAVVKPRRARNDRGPFFKPRSIKRIPLYNSDSVLTFSTGAFAPGVTVS